MPRQIIRSDDARAIVSLSLSRRRGSSVELSTEEPPPPSAPRGRPLRVARMLAVAHEIARLIAEGRFDDQADAARALGFTRARVTQLLDLTRLAPDLQDRILFAEAEPGRDALSERGLRHLVRHLDWAEKRARWRTAD